MRCPAKTVGDDAFRIRIAGCAFELGEAIEQLGN